MDRFKSIPRKLVPEVVYDYIRSRQSHYRHWAFHGDGVYQRLVKELIRTLDIAQFVETGTYLGDSSRFIAEAHPDLPILTCEVHPRFCRRARRRLRRFASVELVHGSSAEILAERLESWRDARRPLFYLDAHWHDYWPLRDELDVISKGHLSCVIIIDDFEVPHRTDFSFDTYAARGTNGESGAGSAVVCGTSLLADAVGHANRYDVLLPRYNRAEAFPREPDRPLVGHAVVFQNLPEEVERLVSQNPFFPEHYHVCALTSLASTSPAV